MSESPTGYAEALVLLALSLGPLMVDLALLFFAMWLAQFNSLLLLLAPVPVYLLLNVAVPLWVSMTYFRDELAWLIALFVLVKLAEFALFKVGSMYAGLFVDTWRRIATSGIDGRNA
jgi:hypothetical protein